MLGARMKEDGFDIMTTPCGPNDMYALWFAIGEKGDPPHDEKAVKLILGVPGVDINATNSGGQSMLWRRSRSVKLSWPIPASTRTWPTGTRGCAYTLL